MADEQADFAGLLSAGAVDLLAVAADGLPGAALSPGGRSGS
jgi:hypothetical protein